jgi:hypothetical protein
MKEEKGNNVKVSQEDEQEPPSLLGEIEVGELVIDGIRDVY